MAIFKGAGVAIVTPMYDNEEVNYDKLEELINMQIDNGTDAIIIAGTTGESPCLSMEEHAKVIKAAVEFTKHRVPVVAGTGSNCTKTAMQLSKEAEEFGADGLLVVTPYYNKATQAGLVSHYSQIADSTKCPIIVYNVPGRTGCNVLPETMAELFKTKENIVGLKEATGMVIGQCSKAEDIELNVCKKKHLTNTRSSSADEALTLVPPKVLSLEQAIDFIDTDELLEVTPESLRIRKKILDPTLRKRAGFKKN